MEAGQLSTLQHMKVTLRLSDALFALATISTRLRPLERPQSTRLQVKFHIFFQEPAIGETFYGCFRPFAKKVPMSISCARN